MTKIVLPVHDRGVASIGQGMVNEVLAILRDDDIQAQQCGWISVEEDSVGAVLSFEGEYADGFRALSRVMESAIPLVTLRRAWWMIDGELKGPHWEIVLGPFES